MLKVYKRKPIKIDVFQIEKSDISIRQFQAFRSGRNINCVVDDREGEKLFGQALIDGGIYMGSTLFEFGTCFFKDRKGKVCPIDKKSLSDEYELI